MVAVAERRQPILTRDDATVLARMVDPGFAARLAALLAAMDGEDPLGHEPNAADGAGEGPPALATWLRAELARRGWRQRRLAERVRVSAGRISEWVNGERTPSPESCVRLADALDADVDYVLTLAGHRPLQWRDDDDPEVVALIAMLRRALANRERAAERIEVLRGVLAGMLKTDQNGDRPPRAGSAGPGPRPPRTPTPPADRR
jgi:transcriptional regulator with XRE-family HTH domain